MSVFLGVANYLSLLDSAGRPRCPEFYRSLYATMELLTKEGIPWAFAKYEGCCYVQVARNELIQLFLPTEHDTLFYLDDDLEWKAEDFLRVLTTPGGIVAGTYRRKRPDNSEDYPIVVHCDDRGIPITREDGAIWTSLAATGFMKVERQVIKEMIAAHPELEYWNVDDKGEFVKGFYDLFPQGVAEKRWWGEDAAFCRLYEALGGKIWTVPNMTLTHYGYGRSFTGNYHEFLTRCPGGSNDKQPVEAGTHK